MANSTIPSWIKMESWSIQWVQLDYLSSYSMRISWSKDQSQLELSLAQLSPSLFCLLFILHIFFDISDFFDHFDLFDIFDILTFWYFLTFLTLYYSLSNYVKMSVTPISRRLSHRPTKLHTIDPRISWTNLWGQKSWKQHKDQKEVYLECPSVIIALFAPLLVKENF